MSFIPNLVYIDQKIVSSCLITGGKDQGIGCGHVLNFTIKTFSIYSKIPRI